jgi:hypothetical protein
VEQVHRADVVGWAHALKSLKGPLSKTIREAVEQALRASTTRADPKAARSPTGLTASFQVVATTRA